KERPLCFPSFVFSVAFGNFLMGIDDPEHVNIQIARLAHAHSKGKIAAAQSLAAMRNSKKRRAAVPALIRASNDADPMVCLDAARALFRIDPGNDVALQTFLQALTHEQDDVRIESAVALMGLPCDPAKILPSLLKALKDPCEEVRYRSCGVIQELGRTETGDRVGDLPASLTAPA